MSKQKYKMISIIIVFPRESLDGIKSSLCDPGLKISTFEISAKFILKWRSENRTNKQIIKQLTHSL